MADISKKSPKRNQVQPRVKFWFESDGEYAFGFGISRILSAVAETGSIKAAAESQGKSYRYVWSRIKEAELTLDQPLVETRVGGSGVRRSSLTELANHLVQSYDALRQRMREVVRDEFSTRFNNRP